MMYTDSGAGSTRLNMHMHMRALLEQTLTEMPVRAINHIGNWDRSHGFRDPMDRRAITAPKLMDKVRKKLAGSDHDFVFYFINSPGSSKASMAGETQVGTEEYYRYLPPKVTKQIDADHAAGALNDAITIIYAANQSLNREKMTPWIIIHRMWHAFDPKIGQSGNTSFYVKEAEAQFTKLSKEVLSQAYKVQVPRSAYSASHYSPGAPGFMILKRFYEAIGTTRACREGNLSFPTELFADMFTQYVTTGKIPINPVPQGIRGVGRLMDDQAEYANETMQAAVEQFTDSCYNILGASVNSIFMV